MPPRVRRLTLTLHITLSVGWIGAVVAFLALVFTAQATTDAPTLRGAWLAMDTIGRLAIVPLAFASLATGLVVSLGSKWGLFRHYWVLISLVATVLATAVLLSNMQTVGFYAAVAAGLDGDAVGSLRGGLAGEVFHAGLGLLVLIVIQVLNVYKPRGMTRYGQRRKGEQRQPRQRPSW